MTTTRYGQAWNRDELILALYYYCQIPFAKTKANNPKVIELSHLLGRSPGSVARKLGNFGAFDPALAARGIAGLQHVSANDRAIWEHYQAHWDVLVDDAARLLGRRLDFLYDSAQPTQTANVELPSGPSEVVREQRVRRHQAFFRSTVLASYREQCAVCSLDLPVLLTASHIIPWSENEKHRANPHNGLCLCSIHDRAFDRGILGIDEHLIVSVSAAKAASRTEAVERFLKAYQGSLLRIPQRFEPQPEFLRWHWQNVFLA